MLKLVKRLTPLTGEGWGQRGEKGARDKVTKRRRGREGVERGGPSAREGWLYLEYMCRAPSF